MVRLSQNSFFGGQLDFEMMGRQDYQRYAKGATKLCNFNIMKRGGLDKRRGFDRIMRLDSLDGVTVNTKFRAIPFAYKKTQGFVLLMSSAKCIVVWTSPNVQFTYYSIDDLDGVYTADEIQELDYQQCGDELFIAHQNHPPAKITHDIDDVGEHGFHYSVLDLNDKMRGIPSITDSLVTRLIVEDDNKAASLFTEKYKVTAVFDGVETFPCDAYSKELASPYGIKSWKGTNYPMPWTESQKIRLTIKPVTKTDSDGILVYPEEIRVYKKSFNYYGLIGTVPITTQNTTYAPASLTADSTVENSDGSSENYLTNTASDVPDHGVGCIGHKFGTTVKTFSATTCVDGYLELFLGSTYYTVGEKQVTFNYVGWDATKCTVRHGTRVDNTRYYTEKSASMPTCSGKVTTTIKQEEDESDADFLSRWKDEYDTFCASLVAVTSVKIPFSHTATGTAFSVFFDADCYVSCVRVVAYGTLGNVTFDDKYFTPDSSNTPPEYDEDNPMFSGAGNYPASVALSQQRLIWASTKNDPARVWASEVGDFYTYSNHEIQVASDPIDFILPVTRFAKINHICEMRKLLMFNSACEWLVDSASTVQGLTYETIQAYPQSYSGSSERLKPIICNNSLIFCERTGQAVRRFAYDISNDGFAGRDVSILSSSIFENNSIVDWTYQQFPYSTLWCAMADGTMSSFEYMEEQDIMAWMTHKLGGDGKIQCLATSYAVSPALDDVTNADIYPYATHEEIFAVVKRQNSLWLERMRCRSKPAADAGDVATDTIYHSLCLDGVRVLNKTNGYTPTTEYGVVWIPADTTDGSTVDITTAKAKIAAGVDVYEGFPFTATYTSVYPSYNNGAVGMGQFNIKRVNGCGMRLMWSYGGEVKAVGSDTAEPILYDYGDEGADHNAVFSKGNVSLHNHDTRIMSLAGENNRDGRVTVTQSSPYPFAILSYDIELEAEYQLGGGQ